MTTAMLTPELLRVLCAVDTPTICNALELALGGRSAEGFTRGTLIAAPYPLPSIVGYVRTATIRASTPAAASDAELRERRIGYYRYVANAPDGPVIVVMQDTDERPGTGSFWGEVNSTVHEGLGVSGVLTNGSVRDLGDISRTFPILAGSIGPSHAFVHLTGFGEPVEVFGLTLAHDDLLHADRHGAVRIPAECLAALPDCIRLTQRREGPLIAAARGGAFDIGAIERALREADDIH